MDDIPYLLRGITQLSTASSTLISSSKYLNNAKLRDWVAAELLRRNGPDLPTPSGSGRGQRPHRGRTQALAGI